MDLKAFNEQMMKLQEDLKDKLSVIKVNKPEVLGSFTIDGREFEAIFTPVDNVVSIRFSSRSDAEQMVGKNLVTKNKSRWSLFNR
jgi:hypothetical protein